MIDTSKGLFSLMVFDFRCGALFFFPSQRYTQIHRLVHSEFVMLTGRMKTSS